MDICKSNQILLAFQYRCGVDQFFPHLSWQPCLCWNKKIYYFLTPALPFSSLFSCAVRVGLQFSLALTVVQEDTNEIALNKPVQGFFWVTAKHGSWLYPQVSTAVCNKLCAATVKELLVPEQRSLKLGEAPVQRSGTATDFRCHDISV